MKTNLLDIKSQPFDTFIEGAHANHIFPINKTIEERMNVLTNQLIVDIIIREDLEQIDKYATYNFILKNMNKLYMMGRTNEVSHEDLVFFKHETRKNLLHLIFRKVK